jgi:hypothetical protein
MRSACILIFACLIICACKKNNTKATSLPFEELTGSWRMVSVTDLSSNITITKPASLAKDVDLAFTFSDSNTGIINGVTTRNTFSGNCSVSDNRTLLIPDITSTEIAETSWGSLFLNNVFLSMDYEIDIDNKLNINTSSNKTLTFTRR